MASTNKLSFASYNCNGLGAGRIDYINKLLCNHNFVILQEHWLYESGFNTLQSQLYNASVYAISGMDQSKLSEGRPSGGCAIVWHSNSHVIIKPINTICKRICAATISTEDLTFLMLCVYMPCDGITNNVEFEAVLAEASRICNGSDANMFILGGDFNTDLSRKQSSNTVSLLRFCKEETLTPCVDSLLNNVDFTYESKINGSRSCLDHFIITDNLLPLVSKYYSVKDVDNLSDHCAVSLTIDIPVKLIECLSYVQNNNDHINWNVVTDDYKELYCQKLENLLRNINMADVESCKSMNAHESAIDAFYNDIVKACITAASECFPKKKTSKHSFPWSDDLCHLRETALFWHWLWKENGCPHTGHIASVRQNSRSKYHYAIRAAKRQQDSLRNTRLSEALVKNRSSNFWSVVKKVKTCSNKVPNVIDDCVGPEEISDLFADKYDSLFNSVSYNKNDMQNLLSDVDNMILNGKCTCKLCSSNSSNVTCVDSSTILQALHHIKRSKSDCMSDLKSDHLLFGPMVLLEKTACLFNCMLQYCYCPVNMRYSSINPLIKNSRKSSNDSDNYRGIAISSLFGKLFDWVLILTQPDALQSSNMQYAFKPDHSTAMCNFVVRENINYYNSHGSEVHAVLLDASKAFDRVNFVKLFHVLKSKGCCPNVIKLLIHMYTNQNMCVKWCNVKSKYFSVSNGVKQGGVLSPILFNLYLDNMLGNLSLSKLGCHIGDTFTGAVAYADDVVLMAPTLTAVNYLLDICNDFSEKYDVKFNPSKSKYVYFPPKNCIRDTHISHVNVSLGNVPIPSVPHEKHVGIWIGQDAFKLNVDKCICDLHACTNNLVNTFRNNDIDVMYKLFKSYGMSVYGSQIWDFSNIPVCNKFYTCWRKCIRNLLDLPYRTHNDLIPGIISDSSVEFQLHCRCLKFVFNVLNSSNPCIKTCGLLAINGSKSHLCNSINYLCKLYNMDKFSLVNQYLPTKRPEPSAELKPIVGAIQELKSAYKVGTLSKDDRRNLIFMLCTS